MTTLVESGESVLLAGWHREVYEIWQKRFDRANVKWGMITGSESASAKEKAKQQFIQGEIKVLML